MCAILNLHLFRMETTVTHMNTPEATNRSLLNVIEEAREGAGLSQRDLSVATGIPLTTLHSKLKGHRSFTVIELASIAEALRLSLTELALRAERSQLAKAG